MADSNTEHTIVLTTDEVENLHDALIDAHAQAERDLDSAEADNDHEAVEVYRDKFFEFGRLIDKVYDLLK